VAGNYISGDSAAVSYAENMAIINRGASGTRSVEQVARGDSHSVDGVRPKFFTLHPASHTEPNTHAVVNRYGLGYVDTMRDGSATSSGAIRFVRPASDGGALYPDVL
jgi:hypothetical protein